MEKSRIFWFSGTGNSLYAAKKLSAELENIPLSQMTSAVPSETVGGNGEKVGFVFPAFYLNMPRTVKKFVEALTIEPETYIFAIITMGASSGKGAVSAIRKAIKAKGHKLSYGRGIKMPDNYVLLYNPTDPNTCSELLNKNDSELCQCAAEIKAGVQTVKAIPFSMNSLYNNIERLDKKFTVSDTCTGCGLCKRLCPTDNIELKDNKPTWQHKCEHCVACISWCPVRAIEYGNKTQRRNRYHNPRIKAEELISP